MAERDLARLIASLAPRLDPAPWVFVTSRRRCPRASPLMTFREDEGETAILSPAEARRLGPPDRPVFRRIVLDVIPASRRSA